MVSDSGGSQDQMDVGHLVTIQISLSTLATEYLQRKITKDIVLTLAIEVTLTMLWHVGVTPLGISKRGVTGEVLIPTPYHMLSHLLKRQHDNHNVQAFSQFL